ncbi:MAG: hypothetical protein DRO05_08460 [Thermoproteota archaeon]|nr:MAG: hypothetical protein DRO05_08460 [Candidatus Korarchaeota archaeon]
MDEEREEWEERWEEFEKRWEEWAEEFSKRIGLIIEKAIRGAFRGAMLAPRAVVAVRPRLLEEEVHWHKRPIPIRNLSRTLYSRIREIAESRGVTIGEVMNEAMSFYLMRYDEATLEREKQEILKKIEEIGGLPDPDVRELLLREYQEILSEVKRRLSELRSKKEGGAT